MESPISLKEIQYLEFEILKYIKNVCEQNGLRYYLAYGTLIGAVRHQGFVPWDDDMDIQMPREDYLKFVAIVKKNPHPYYRLLSRETSNKYTYLWPKVIDTRTRMTQYGSYLEKEKIGLFVDIFLLDGAGNSREEAEATYCEAYSVFHRYRRSVLPMFFRGENKLISFLKWIHHIPEKAAGIHYWMEQHERVCRKKRFDECKYVGALGAGTMEPSRNIWERESFGNGRPVSFMGEAFMAPDNWDAVLRPEYGGYMELPPPYQQKAHHYYKLEVLDPGLLNASLCE